MSKSNALLTAALLSAAILVAITPTADADDLGGGAPAAGGLVPQLVADHWIPGRVMTLSIRNVRSSLGVGICVIGTSTRITPLPRGMGTLHVDLSNAMFLPIRGSRAVGRIPAQLEGARLYIQALVFDGAHPAGGVLTDATAIDVLTPLALVQSDGVDRLNSLDVTTFSITGVRHGLFGHVPTFAHDHQRAYVAGSEAGALHLSRVDLVGGRPASVRTIPLSSGARMKGAITNDGRFLYVPTSAGIAVVDVAQSVEIRRIPTTYVGRGRSVIGPMAVELTPDGRYLYVCYGVPNRVFPGTADIGVFDLTQPNPTERLLQVPLGGVLAVGGMATYYAVDISGDGRWLCIGEYGIAPGPFVQGFTNGSFVHVFDTRTSRLLASVPTGGYGQRHLAIDRLGKNIYVAQVNAQQVGEVIRIDCDHRSPTRFQVVQRHAIPGAYAAGLGPTGIDVLPDGSEVIVGVNLGSQVPGALIRVDTATNQRTAGPLVVGSIPSVVIQQRVWLPPSLR